VILEKRSSFGWPTHPDVSRAPCDKGTVVHYNDKPKMHWESKPHSECISYWKGVRRFHMGPERNWSDIGYAFFCCGHGRVLEGRGYGYSQAAQPGGNTTWTSVTFATGEGERPSEAAIKAYRELRSWLRGKGMSAGERKHKDFLSTTCPGTVLSDMVGDGSLRGGSTTPKPPAKPGTKAPAFPLPAGHWFGPESSDSKNHSGYSAKDRPNIAKIIDRLRSRGWSVAKGDRYTTAVASTIRKFQAEKGLSIDGLTGAKTWKALWESPIT
jgi:putative peptidoglycan binding protein